MANQTKNATVAILKAWLLAGTLDGISAITYYTIKGGKNPEKIFIYIASGLLGKDALTGGTEMICLGILFHYLFALAFTLFFFFICSYINILLKNKFITGLCYGVFVWVVMNLLVVPNSFIGKYPSKIDAIIINMLILMFMIGLPISYIIGNYYSRKRKIEKFSEV